MYIWNSFSSNIHTYLSNLDQVSKNSMFLKMTRFSHMIAYFNICRDFSVTQKKNYIVNASIYSLHCQCMKLRNSCRNYSESAGNFAFFSEKITPSAGIFRHQRSRQIPHLLLGWAGGWWLFHQTGKISNLLLDNKCNLNSVFRLLMYFSYL